MSRVLSCRSCRLVRINGVVCHETGCPDRNRLLVRTWKVCKWCGRGYVTKNGIRSFCERSCKRAYYS